MIKEVIVNVKTGEIITQEVSAERVIEIQKFNQEQAKLNSQLQEAAAAKEAARQALLDKLNITADEAKLLLS